MNELTKLALELQGFCDGQGWRYCIIGGLAVQHWGEPRMTRDVDMTLLAGFGDEEQFIRPWLSHYQSRIPDALDFAIANRVLLLKSNEGIGIDVALGALPFEESAVNRSREVELEPGAMVRLCTAEDLIVMKAFADRPRDWLDLRGILVRQTPERLNWVYIWQELAPLCEIKDQPAIITRLKSLQEEIRS